MRRQAPLALIRLSWNAQANITCTRSGTWRDASSRCPAALALCLVILILAVYNVSVNDRPLREPTFLILTALAAGPQHGYGIMTDVEHISGGRVKLRPGTLYAALDRVAAEGLVEADREEVVDGRLRRYYRLTPGGGRRLAAEAARLQANATAALRRLRADPAGGLA